MNLVIEPEKMSVAELLAVLTVFAKDLPRTFHENADEHAALWADVKAILAELERRYPVAPEARVTQPT